MLEIMLTTFDRYLYLDELYARRPTWMLCQEALEDSGTHRSVVENSGILRNPKKATCALNRRTRKGRASNSVCFWNVVEFVRDD